MVVVLDFGTLEHLIAHAREDRLDLLAHDREGMTMADRRPATGQRDIDSADRRLRCVEAGLSRAELLLDVLLELVGELAESGLERGRRRRHRFHQGGDGAALSSEVFVAERLKIRLGHTRASSSSNSARRRVMSESVVTLMRGLRTSSTAAPSRI